MHPLGYIDAPHPALPLEDIRSSLLTGAYRIRELAFSYYFSYRQGVASTSVREPLQARGQCRWCGVSDEEVANIDCKQKLRGR